MLEAVGPREEAPPPPEGYPIRGGAEGQRTERTFKEQHDNHEQDLPSLDTQVEEEQRQGNLGPWQPHGGETARETEPVQEPESEGHHPRVADGEARLPT